MCKGPIAGACDDNASDRFVGVQLLERGRELTQCPVVERI
jgi:hypothetical protein